MLVSVPPPPHNCTHRHRHEHRAQPCARAGAQPCARAGGDVRSCAAVSHAAHRRRVCTHPGGRVGSTARHARALKMLAISRHGRRPHGPVRFRRWGIHEPRRRAGPECSDRSFSKCRPQRAGLECSDRSFSKCRPQHQPCGCDGHDVAEEGCVARASSSPTQRDHVQVRVARLDRT